MKKKYTETASFYHKNLPCSKAAGIIFSYNGKIGGK